MIVEIINHTPQPQHTIALAARQCYSSGYAPDAASTVEQDATLIKKVIGFGHVGILEHASFTFGIQGISRVCSHQLTRFRVASFSQQSQRYASISDNYETPGTIKSSNYNATYVEAIRVMHNLYSDMVAAGIPKEDARYILPGSTHTNIVMTMNARELTHAFNLRCCNRAQHEIRMLFNEILQLVKPIAPAVFENAGPLCFIGECPEGAMSCGKSRKQRCQYE